MSKASDGWIRMVQHTPLLAQHLGDSVQVGAGFAYLAPGLGEHAAVRRIAQPLLLGSHSDEAHLVCLWGDGRIALPGAVVTRREPPRWFPAGLWVDRSSYAYQAPVHLVIEAPGCVLETVLVTLLQPGEHERVMTIKLHGGAGHVELRGLPPGVWTLRALLPWPDLRAPRTLTVRFEVREPGIVPLSAHWVTRRGRLRGDGHREFFFCVALESFGEPTQGPTRVTLENLRLRERTLLGDHLRPDPMGLVQGRAILQDQGPFVLHFEHRGALASQASLTIPPGETQDDSLGAGALVGDSVLRVAEIHEQGTALGLEVVSAQVARGPFLIDVVSLPGALKVFAREPCLTASLILLEPLSGWFQVHDLGAMERGEEIVVEHRDTLGIAVVGAVPEEENPDKATSWEGYGVWATQVHDTRPTLSWAAHVKPEAPHGEGPWAAAQSRPVLVLEAGKEEAPEGILLLVTHQDNPEPPGATAGVLEPLGCALLDRLRDLLKSLETPARLPSLFEAAGGQRALHTLLRQMLGQEEAPLTHPMEMSGAVQARPRPVQGRDHETLLVRLLEVPGRIEVRLPPMPASGVVHVQAVVVTRRLWASATTSLKVGDPVGVQWMIPAFVDAGDEATGCLKVQSWAGPAKVRLCHEGEAVALTLCSLELEHPSRRLEEGERLPQQALLSFPVAPGTWTLELGPWGQDGGPWLRREAVVSQAGRSMYSVRHLRCLDADASIEHLPSRGLVHLPNLLALLPTYLQTLRAMGWETCEVLAARVLGLTVGLLRGLEAAEDLLEELIRVCGKLRALFVPGQGWSARSPGDGGDPVLAGQSTRHLLRLAALVEELREDDAVHQRARPLLEGMVHLGQRAAIVSGMVLPPPVESLRDADDAELLWRMRPSRLMQAAATARARVKRRASRLDGPRGGRMDEPEQRADRAFAAHVLMATGEEADAVLALRSLSQACVGTVRGPLAPIGAWGASDAAAMLVVLHALGDAPGVISRPDQRTWVSWESWEADDLSDPASLVPLRVCLMRRGSRTPETRFKIGDLVDLEVDLGRAPDGGARPGDWLEIHLPASLAPVPYPGLRAERRGRLLRIDLENRNRLTLGLRTVSLTGGTPRIPKVQHFAVALRNSEDPKRGRGLLGLDVAVVDTGDLATLLRRGVQDLLG